MNMLNRSLVSLSAAALCASVGLAASSGVDHEIPGSTHDAAALTQLLKAAPGVRFLEIDGTLKRVYGPNLSAGMTGQQSAQNFIKSFVSLFGASPAELEAWALCPHGGNAIPLMPGDDGAPKFTLHTFRQVLDGIPVYRSDLRLLTRNTRANDLVWVGNALRPVAGMAIDAAARANPNTKAAFAATEILLPVLAGGTFSQPELTIFAGVDADKPAPRLAVVFTATTAAQPWEAGYGKWEVVADATTGEILFSESQVHDVDVSGRISGVATNGIRAAECDPETDQGLPYALVTIGALSGYASSTGNYTMIGVPAGNYTVSAGPRGRYFDTYNPTALVPNTTGAANVPNIQLNAANTDETVRAGVNAYLQANIVRDMVVAASPSYPTIAGQFNFRINVAVAGTCNAFYNGTSINFYNAGGGCNNTAFYDVVHHEYGHHVVATGGSGQGQYGEGMGDCMGVIISDQPLLGIGFQSCGSGIRNASNTLQYPQGAGVEIHSAGQLISACVWSTRNQLVTAGVSGYQTLLKQLCVNSVPLHSGTTIAPDITVDWLTLDDTDGNINNGTPHYAQINAGFTEHNMDGPALTLVDFVFPDGLLASSITPNTPATIRVNVVGLSGVPVDNTGVLTYRVDAGSNTSVPMTRIAANQYIATIPPQACGAQIAYSFSAQAVGGTIGYSPAGAPAVAYATVPSSGSTVRFSDNFNTNLGWVAAETPTGGGTASGAFARGPQLDTNGAAPSADFDGSGQMYSTDPRAGAGVGTYDVDNNTVTLTSPTMDASGGPAQISYARWFSNDAGASPDDDRLLVQVSGNNGASWLTLEQVGPNGGEEQHGGWYPKTFSIPAAAATNQFKIRFTTSDNVAIAPATSNAGSITEVAIDAVQLRVLACSTPGCPADWNNDNGVDGDDVIAFFAEWDAGNADFNGDGGTDGDDVIAFFGNWDGGC
ncbi:MAG: hypothetical protein ACOYN0_09130 [Phycisphaerales bacterium]